MFKIDISSFLFNNFLLYGAWITFHYLSGHLYTYICVPKTISGYLLSPFVVASPQCTAIRWVITKSGDNICTMWMVLGNLCITQIDVITNYAKNKT
jgi:hypothetical protein